MLRSVIAKFKAAIAAVGIFVFVLLFPLKAEQFPAAFKSWARLMPSRETLWMAFSACLIAYIFWIELRPTVLAWWRKLPRKLNVEVEVTTDKEGPPTAPTLANTTGVKIVRLRVESIVPESIDRCEAQIRRVTKRAPNSSEFVTLYEGPPFGIMHPDPIVHPERPIWFELIWSHELNNCLTRAHAVAWPYKLLDALTDVGTFRFDALVVAPYVPAEKITIEVDWPGKWDGLTARKL